MKIRLFERSCHGPISSTSYLTSTKCVPLRHETTSKNSLRKEEDKTLIRNNCSPIRNTINGVV